MILEEAKETTNPQNWCSQTVTRLGFSINSLLQMHKEKCQNLKNSHDSNEVRFFVCVFFQLRSPVKA